MQKLITTETIINGRKNELLGVTVAFSVIGSAYVYV
jgi:hypothetical protein